MRPIKVLKFGGTSVGSAERLRQVVEIVREAAETHRVVVTASALAGVTDLLVEAWDRPATSPEQVLGALRQRHLALAADLLQPPSRTLYEVTLDRKLEDVRPLLDRVRTAPTAADRDVLIAVGERLSVPLVASLFIDSGIPSVSADAACLIRTDDRHGEANVDVEQTRRQIQGWFETIPVSSVPVVTGFLGATAEGATTTLGRGGSDYSAALLASALRAQVLERWTDVDGIYTDDPRTNEHAHRLASIVLEEAWAWNHAGKLGMHRKALDPLVAEGIPVHVRSTAAPDKPGTLILPSGHEQARRAV